MKRLSRAVVAVFWAALTLAAAAWIVGTAAIAPRPSIVGPPPPWLAAETATLAAAGAPDLTGWIAAPPGACAAVALFHGRGADRRQLLGRARLLLGQGYAVALFDFQGHGESGGDALGFGYHEADDVRRVVTALRERAPDRPVGVLGVSLGAAAAVMAGPEVRADAYLLEALYSDLIETTARRLWVPVLTELQATALHWQTPLRVGHWASDLAPVERIGDLEAPVLLVAGTHDAMATPAQTERLYAAATAPKTLLWIDGAGHQDFLRASPSLYADGASRFFAEAFGC